MNDRMYAASGARSKAQNFIGEIFRLDNLGPSASWHIRSVPEAVRQAIVDRAHAERVSVGELLTRLVVRGDAPNLSTGDVSPHASTVDADRLVKLLECAEMVHRGDLPTKMRRAVEALISAEIRSMRRGQRQGVRALPAPRDESAPK